MMISIGLDLGWYGFGFDLGQVSVFRCGVVRFWTSRRPLFEELIAHHSRVTAMRDELRLLHRQEAATRVRPVVACHG